MRNGEPMMIPCEGGPTGWRVGTFPPVPEFEVDDGVYVLVDDGPPDRWTYEFIVGSSAT